MATASSTQTEQPPSSSLQQHHHLPWAFLWAFPVLMLSILLLLAVEAFIAGLRRLVQLAPAAGFVLSPFERALGGGQELPLSLTAVLLSAVLLALLVLSIGISELVALKSEEMTHYRAARHEALATEPQPPQRATRQRRAS